MVDMSVDVDDLMKQIEFEENKNLTNSVPKESGQNEIAVVNFGNKQVAIDDDDAMFAAIMSTALDDKKQSDELYNYYVSRIEMDKDRSDSVREGLAKAVELRQNSTSNLIRLMDMKKKYAAKAVQGNALVNLNLSPRETGINIKSLQDEILNG